MKGFRKGSQAHTDILENLKSLICNKKDRKVCCKIPDDNPTFADVTHRPSSTDTGAGNNKADKHCKWSKYKAKKHFEIDSIDIWYRYDF